MKHLCFLLFVIPLFCIAQKQVKSQKIKSYKVTIQMQDGTSKSYMVIDTGHVQKDCIVLPNPFLLSKDTIFPSLMTWKCGVPEIEIKEFNEAFKDSICHHNWHKIILANVTSLNINGMEKYLKELKHSCYIDSVLKVNYPNFKL